MEAPSHSVAMEQGQDNVLKTAREGESRREKVQSSVQLTREAAFEIWCR